MFIEFIEFIEFKKKFSQFAKSFLKLSQFVILY